MLDDRRVGNFFGHRGPMEVAGYPETYGELGMVLGNLPSQADAFVAIDFCPSFQVDRRFSGLYTSIYCIHMQHVG